MKTFTKEHSKIVKGVAIMLLLVYHLFHDINVLVDMQVNYAPFSQNGFLQFAGFGNICVAVFVMLTAYGLSQSFLSQQEGTIKDAYIVGIKRFGKMMLNFFIVYIAINLVCFRFFDYASLYGEGKQGILMMLCDATGLSAVLKTPMLNETWWYMKLAYILIFLIPFMALVAKKVGKTFLLLAFLAPFVIVFDGDVERYFFVAAFGVAAAYGNWFEKIMNLKIHPVFWWTGAVLGGVLSVLIRQNAVVRERFWNYADAFVAFFIICAVTMTVGRVPVLNKVIAFVGKHAMNIFLVHTIFYMVVWRKYIYYFEYAIVTFLILLGVSLLFSVILELVKKYIYKFVNFLQKKVKKG